MRLWYTRTHRHAHTCARTLLNDRFQPTPLMENMNMCVCRSVTRGLGEQALTCFVCVCRKLFIDPFIRNWTFFRHTVFAAAIAPRTPLVHLASQPPTHTSPRPREIGGLARRCVYFWGSLLTHGSGCRLFKASLQTSVIILVVILLRLNAELQRMLKIVATTPSRNRLLRGMLAIGGLW